MQGDGTYLCPVNVDWHAPDSMFQILMVLSSEQLARMLGFWGSKATQRTKSLLANTKLERNHHRRLSFQTDGTYLCPANVDWSSPDDAFQILTVASQLPLAICLPSELKQTLTTGALLKNTKSVPIYKRRHSIQGDGTYLCPVNVDWHSNVPDDPTDQTLTVLS